MIRGRFGLILSAVVGLAIIVYVNVVEATEGEQAVVAATPSASPAPLGDASPTASPNASPDASRDASPTASPDPAPHGDEPEPVAEEWQPPVDAFLAAYLDGPDSQPEWGQAIAPHVTEALAAGFAYTDPSTVPAGPAGVAVLLGSGLGLYVVEVPLPDLTLTLTVELDGDGSWRVSKMEQR